MMDIDNKELVTYRRKSYIVNMLFEVSAKEIACTINNMVEKDMQRGAYFVKALGGTSATSLEQEAKLFMYFDKAITSISERKITDDLAKVINVGDMDELIECIAGEWKEYFCVQHRNIIKYKTLGYLSGI